MDSQNRGRAETVGERRYRVGPFLPLAAGLLFILAPAATLAEQKSSGPALSKGEIVQMLKGAMEQAQLGQLARQYGVSFEMTLETEKELRDAGANDSLIDVLREAAPKPASPSPPPASAPEPAPAAPPAGSPVLVIESKPGGAQVYVDDEPVGKTSGEGRLKLSTLAPGEHRLRLALEGYKDNEQKLQLGAGEAVRMVVSLEAIPAPAPQPAAPPLTQPAAPTRTEPRMERFTVSHFHKSAMNPCEGWLIVGNGRLKYQALESDHSFDESLSDIAEAKRNPMFISAMKGFHIKMSDGTNYNFAMHRGGRYVEPSEIFDAIERAQAGSASSEAPSAEESELSAKERARKEKRALVLGRRSRK